MQKTIAQNIRKLRLQKRLTQEQVAEAAGINAKYLGEIERGVKSPTAVVVNKLAAALGVPICLILTADGCPCSGDGYAGKVMQLMKGQEPYNIKKAMRILEIYFE